MIDFITGLLILIKWKKNNYNSIFVIIDWLTMMMYYKPLKININALGPAKVFIW